jgi:hypothetical protein
MVKWIMIKSPYGQYISSLAEFHDFLAKKGYSYFKTKEYGKNKKLLYKKGNSIVEIVRVQEGLPARKVNIPISKMMTMTRMHGTPDVYKLKKRKPRK